MKQTVKWIAMMAALTTLMMCASACGTDKKAAGSTTAPVQTTGAAQTAQTEPTMAEGVEDWGDTGATQGTQSSQPTEATAQSQSGNQTETPTPPEDGKLTYEAYQAMSTVEKQAYFLSFEDPEDFYAWLDEAEAAYKEKNPDNNVSGDGTLNLEDYIKG